MILAKGQCQQMLIINLHNTPIFSISFLSLYHFLYIYSHLLVSFVYLIIIILHTTHMGKECEEKTFRLYTDCTAIVSTICKENK